MYSIDELITTIYESNLSHFEFMEAMNGGDCDCVDHITLNNIARHVGIEVG